jgi:hypothetical protein
MPKQLPRPIRFGCNVGTRIVMSGNVCKLCKINGVPISCSFGTPELIKEKQCMQ